MVVGLIHVHQKGRDAVLHGPLTLIMTLTLDFQVHILEQEAWRPGKLRCAAILTNEMSNKHFIR